MWLQNILPSRWLLSVRLKRKHQGVSHVDIWSQSVPSRGEKHQSPLLRNEPDVCIWEKAKKWMWLNEWRVKQNVREIVDGLTYWITFISFFKDFQCRLRAGVGTLSRKGTRYNLCFCFIKITSSCCVRE